MTENDIPTLEARRTVARLKFLFTMYDKSLEFNGRTYIQPYLSRASRHRHAHNLLPFRARTNLFKNSFFPRTVVQWNDLPSEIFSADNFEQALLMYFAQ